MLIVLYTIYLLFTCVIKGHCHFPPTFLSVFLAMSRCINRGKHNRLPLPLLSTVLVRVSKTQFQNLVPDMVICGQVAMRSCTVITITGVVKQP